MSEQLLEDERTSERTPSFRRVITDEVTINLFQVVRRLLAARWLIVILTLVGLAGGIVLALVTHPWYEAIAVFMTPALPDPGAVSGASALLGREDPTDVYLGLLASRSVADDVIDHLGLMKTFHAGLRTDARGHLAAISRFGVTQNQLIWVAVKVEDPALAARIANAYLDALYRLNGQMVASSSSHREAFLESQLQEQKDQLAKAETEMKTTEEQIGIISPEGEAQAGLSATAQLQSQIGAAETRLAGLRAGATDQNPEVVEARLQLGALQAQLEHVQQSSGTRRPGGGLASTRELPGLSLEYARKMRELKERESIYNGLTQSYERARLATIDPGPQLQVVDMAIPPERKGGPSRKLYALEGAALGLGLSLAYVLLSNPLRKLHRAFRNSSGRYVRA